MQTKYRNLYLYQHFWGLKAGLEPEMQYAAPLPQNIWVSVNLPNFVCYTAAAIYHIIESLDSLSDYFMDVQDTTDHS